MECKNKCTRRNRNIILHTRLIFENTSKIKMFWNKRKWKFVAEDINCSSTAVKVPAAVLSFWHLNKLQDLLWDCNGLDCIETIWKWVIFRRSGVELMADRLVINFIPCKMQMFKEKDVPLILPDTWNVHIIIKEYRGEWMTIIARVVIF